MLSNTLSPREVFIEYLEHFIGGWYTWGGDDPAGFDCSGLVIECCKAVGIIGRGNDYTAERLYRLFLRGLTKKPSHGAAIFYRRKGGPKIVHVEIMINRWHQIGASGGGSRVTSAKTASDHNAYIKLRPIGSNRNLEIAGYTDLFDTAGMPLFENL